MANNQLTLFTMDVVSTETELSKALKTVTKENDQKEVMSIAVSLLPMGGKKRDNLEKASGLQGDKLAVWAAEQRAKLKNIMSREFAGRMSNAAIEPVSIKATKTKGGTKLVFTIIDTSGKIEDREAAIAKALKVLGITREEYDLAIQTRPEQAEATDVPATVTEQQDLQASFDQAQAEAEAQAAADQQSEEESK